MSKLQNNITSLQNLLEQVNALPEEVILPELSNPADASKTLSGYEFINADGAKVTGTISTKTTSSLTANGATVTVPAGYYASDATKSVATATQATPSISVDSAGKITASATQTAGYVSAGTKSSTHQLAFQSAKTITPSSASQIAVSSGYYTGGNVTIVGDSNLVAENIKSGVSIFGVNGTFGGSGNQSGNEDVIINRAISGEYVNDRLESVGPWAFANCTSLTAVSFPNCTSISNSAFYSCTKLTTALFPNCINIGSYAFYSCGYSLTTVSFPNCTSIDTGAFYNCHGLTAASFPSCTSIGSSAFYGCYGLKTVSFPSCTSIGSSAFYRCQTLATASFPNCTSIDAYAFQSCSILTTALFPNCTSIGNSTFTNCKSLATVSFPKCTTIGSYAFNQCSKLATASFPKCTTIGSSAFKWCYLLKSLYLTGSSVCTLANSTAFSSTPIGGYSTWASTYGSIYVPTSLLTSYKAATNWTYFSSRFVGI